MFSSFNSTENFCKLIHSVSYECDVAVNELKLPPLRDQQRYLENPSTMSSTPGWGLHFLPVVMCYEFELQERLADGTRMIARISRSLDPTFKLHYLWLNFTHDQQTLIENRAAKVVEIMPFSELKFENREGMRLFCFVHGKGPQSFVDVATRWTRFARNSKVLDDVRANMKREFRLECMQME
jgi:hypothetical protein